MKKMYTAPEKEITINAGKLNFFDAPRSFADMVDTFANSKMKIASIEKECKDMIKARTILIEEKENSIGKSTYTDLTAVETEVADLKEQIETIKAKKKTLIDSIKAKQFELSEMDYNVWYAYRECKNGTLSEKDYMQAVAMWFDGYGVPAHSDTIKAIINSIGLKKATNGQILKSEGKEFATTMNRAPFIELFYHIIADMCAKAGTIKPFNFSRSYYNA